MRTDDDGHQRACRWEQSQGCSRQKVLSACVVLLHRGTPNIVPMQKNSTLCESHRNNAAVVHVCRKHELNNVDGPNLNVDGPNLPPPPPPASRQPLPPTPTAQCFALAVKHTMLAQG